MTISLVPKVSNVREVLKIIIVLPYNKIILYRETYKDIALLTLLYVDILTYLSLITV